MTAHTDIVSHGWVSRLPESWRPYLLLARLDRPIGTWLLFLPGVWGILLARAPVLETIRLLVLFGAGSLVMRAGKDGNRLGWMFSIRPRQALMFLAALLLCGLLILLSLNRLSQWLGVSSLLLVAFYPLAKRVTWWPQLVMGFTFGFGAPMGYAAAAGRIDLPWALLYAAAILWDLGFDTIYAHQDREDDAIAGVRSTARLFGERTRPFLAACYAGAVACFALAGWSAGLGLWFTAALILPAASLSWQVIRLDIHDPALCLRLFRANREAGLAFAAALLAGLLQAAFS